MILHERAVPTSGSANPPDTSNCCCGVKHFGHSNSVECNKFSSGYLFLKMTSCWFRRLGVSLIVITIIIIKTSSTIYQQHHFNNNVYFYSGWSLKNKNQITYDSWPCKVVISDSRYCHLWPHFMFPRRGKLYPSAQTAPQVKISWIINTWWKIIFHSIYIYKK